MGGRERVGTVAWDDDVNSTAQKYLVSIQILFASDLMKYDIVWIVNPRDDACLQLILLKNNRML